MSGSIARDFPAALVRELARSLATQFPAMSVKNDLKTDAEVQELLEKM